MQYEVKNAPLPVLICKLDPNESIECQKGAMSWMTPTSRCRQVSAAAQADFWAHSARWLRAL